MFVNNKNKWLYISTPKGGTHTLYEMLSYFGGSRYGKFHNRVLDHQHKNYFKFTSVRNPFKRAISVWHSLAFCEPYKSKFGLKETSFRYFSEWLLEKNKNNYKDTNWSLIRSQKYGYNNIKFDLILQIENLKNDFKKLPFVNKEIKIINPFTTRKERSKEWFEYYEGNSQENIYECWKDDFLEYHYENKIS